MVGDCRHFCRYPGWKTLAKVIGFEPLSKTALEAYKHWVESTSKYLVAKGRLAAALYLLSRGLWVRFPPRLPPYNQ